MNLNLFTKFKTFVHKQQLKNLSDGIIGFYGKNFPIRYNSSYDFQ
jgi:hypothetical protein